MTEFVIPGGRCALLRHRGSDDQLGRSIMHLYANWLPTSGEELRDFPLFMQRTKFFPDVPDGEAETDHLLAAEMKRARPFQVRPLLLANGV